MPRVRTTHSMRSSDPRALRSWARAWRPQKRAASTASSTVRSLGTLPVTAPFPSGRLGPWPDTWAIPPAIRTGM